MEAAEKTGVTDQAAADQKSGTGETGRKAEKVADAGEVRSVPLTVLTAVKDELKQAKEAAANYQQQLAAFQGQGRQQQQQTSKDNQVKDPLDGMDDSDLITVSDVKKIMKSTASSSATLTTKLEHLQFAVDHPDYKEAIGNLGTILKDDQNLAAEIHSEIKNSKNPLATAYNYAKLVSKKTASKQSGEKSEIDIMADLEQLIANQNKPGSPAQVQGGGGGVGKAERIKAMSPEEFERHLDRIKSGG